MAPVDGEIFFQDACQILSSAEKNSIKKDCEVVFENVHFSDVHIGPLRLETSYHVIILGPA